ncbi:hypothetical protein NQF86_01575 [Bombella sp. TMW 2.2543]|uniref:Uncharacterized protein n=1 Tax=Bombella pluederhausensis TaxID=2967336 RepID=A0ABT3WE37_9PROT|nr:hypothetical protein [Bombella pluederhausensis]MCX5617365.1 hypothetical protein [Bombella pluederhausensis]
MKLSAFASPACKGQSTVTNKAHMPILAERGDFFFSTLTSGISREIPLVGGMG